jgi:MoxR-like ATPase
VLDLLCDASFFHSLERFLTVAVAPSRSLATSLPIPWQRIRQLVNEDESSSGIFVSPQMGQYARDIASALRQHGRIAFGPSPQGMQAFMHAAKLDDIPQSALLTIVLWHLM